MQKMMGKLILYGGIVLRDASITSWPSDASTNTSPENQTTCNKYFQEVPNDAKGPHRPTAFLKIHGRV